MSARGTGRGTATRGKMSQGAAARGRGPTVTAIRGRGQGTVTASAATAAKTPAKPVSSTKPGQTPAKTVAKPPVKTAVKPPVKPAQKDATGQPPVKTAQKDGAGEPPAKAMKIEKTAETAATNIEKPAESVVEIEENSAGAKLDASHDEVTNMPVAQNEGGDANEDEVKEEVIDADKEVIDVDMEKETESGIVDLTDGDEKEPNKTGSKSNEEKDGNAAEDTKEDKIQFDFKNPPVILEDIPPFDTQPARERFKWTVRIYPISMNDALASGLAAMTKSAEVFIHFNRRIPNKGQMEFEFVRKSDVTITMLRILRAPLMSRIITIEVIKRMKSAETSSTTNDAGDEEAKEEGADDHDAGNENQGADAQEKNEDGDAQGDGDTAREAETKDGADKQGEKGGRMLRSSKRKPYTFLPWTEVGEKAVFMVDLTRTKKIKFMKNRYGDLRRRSVFVGNMPQGCTDEILSVIFPMANAILVRSTDDEPGIRKAFIETCPRSSAVGFVQSYLALRINGVDMKLSIQEEDLKILGEDGDQETGKKEEDKTKDEEAQSEEKKEVEQKTEEKKTDNDSGKAEPGIKKKKRRRDFADEILREWVGSNTMPERGQGHGGGHTGGQGLRGHGAVGTGLRARGSLASGRGMAGRGVAGSLAARKGLAGRQGVMGRDRMSVMQAQMGMMAMNVQAPILSLEGKIQNLMRLQNQLEMTIHNQLNMVDQSQRMRGLGMGAGTGDSGGARRYSNQGSGSGNAGRDNFGGMRRGRDNRNRQGGRGGGGRQGSDRGKGGVGGKRDRRMSGGGGGQQGRFGGGDSPSPSKRFRRDSSGTLSVGNFGLGAGSDRGMAGSNRFGGGNSEWGASNFRGVGDSYDSFSGGTNRMTGTSRTGLDNMSSSSFGNRSRFGDYGDSSFNRTLTSSSGMGLGDYGRSNTTGMGGDYGGRDTGFGSYGDRADYMGGDNYMGSMSRDFSGGSMSAATFSSLDNLGGRSLGSYSGGDSFESGYRRF